MNDKYLYVPLSIEQLKQLYKELSYDDFSIKKLNSLLLSMGYKLEKLPYWSINNNVRFIIKR